MANVVLGVFSLRDRAREAISELEARGYNPKDISIIMRDERETHELAEDTGAGEVVGGTVGGVVTGAILGGIIGLAAAFVIPGVGAFLIGGPMAAALGLSGAAATTASGAATGAVAGGIIGALTSAFSLSDEEARTYEGRIKEGGILVAVPTRGGQEEDVKVVLSQLDADNIRVVETRETTRREDTSADYRGAYFSEIGRPTRKRRRVGRK